jgi:hypothetical protein
MLGIVKSIGAVSYGFCRWQTSQGMWDTTKTVVKDYFSLLKSPFTLYGSFQEEREQYQTCLKAASTNAPFNIRFLPSSINDGLTSVLSGAKGLGCEVHNAQAIFYGIAGLFMAYQVAKHAKSVFSGIHKARKWWKGESLEKPVKEKVRLDLNEQFHTIYKFIQKHGLAIEGFSVDAKGLVWNVTTTKSLDNIQKDFAKEGIKPIKDASGAIAYLELEKDGMGLRIFSGEKKEAVQGIFKGFSLFQHKKG